MNELFTSLKDKVPELVKDNKGAIIGAFVGAFLSDSKQAQSAMLGAVTGNLLVDKNDKKDEEAEEE